MYSLSLLDNIYVGVGAGAGCAILLIAIVLAIKCRKKAQKGDKQTNNGSMELDQIRRQPSTRAQHNTYSHSPVALAGHSEIYSSVDGPLAKDGKLLERKLCTDEYMVAKIDSLTYDVADDVQKTDPYMDMGNTGKANQQPPKIPSRLPGEHTEPAAKGVYDEMCLTASKDSKQPTRNTVDQYLLPKPPEPTDATSGIYTEMDDNNPYATPF